MRKLKTIKQGLFKVRHANISNVSTLNIRLQLAAGLPNLALRCIMQFWKKM